MSARGRGRGGRAGRGGFVVQGKVKPEVAKAPIVTDCVTLESDDDDEVQAVLPDGGYDYNSYGADVPDYGEGEIQRGMDEIQLVRVLPKAKSQAAAPRPELQAELAPSIEVTYNSAAVFSAANKGTANGSAEAWSLDSKIKKGYVKEYVEKNGLGMIFSLECGLILFSDKHLYSGPDGIRAPNAGASNIGAGSEVSFICYQVQSSRCKGWVTEDGYMRQAAALWEASEGDETKPASQKLLREVTRDAHQKDLKKDFEGFLSHIKENRFLPIALVRARGKIAGYLNHKIGIIETEDGRRPNCKVLFHSSDVYLFKTPVALSNRREPIDVLLPVGLNISFDARSIRGDDAATSEVPYQACAVFAGSWPKVPHPTLLPGGQGSYAPVYGDENTSEHTFYYLQLGLTENLDKKWRTFKDTFYPGSGGRFKFVPTQVAIRNGKDHMAWKEQYSPYSNPHKRRHDAGKPFKAENHHKFKKMAPKMAVKVEKANNALDVKVEVKEERV